MPNSLIFFIFILGFISICLMHHLVKSKKMLVSHAVIWDALIALIMIVSLTTNELKSFATFIGIEEVSNLIFFIGFIILLVLNLILTVNISKQKRITISLVQELALTNKRLENMNDSSNKKTNC